MPSPESSFSVNFCFLIKELENERVNSSHPSLRFPPRALQLHAIGPLNLGLSLHHRASRAVRTGPLAYSSPHSDTHCAYLAS
ncbi:hypothetical protein PAXRUDRAFT_821036 [Paxillus rubicundulus Ve08.2h10]|uniref:Uncharacterized protein n=1 Tax=Paxillus rubicundulus Ve08.2h10 TaxID=930991 RepID=A0A0D0EDF4_9AGAM|nr:hypothetical protein PAXRUDRAFT_821036 [Paxillus rubicundulus Ve08.2h10]